MSGRRGYRRLRVGEPALRPPGYPHDASASAYPIRPVAHHWLDSTRVTFGVHDISVHICLSSSCGLGELEEDRSAIGVHAESKEPATVRFGPDGSRDQCDRSREGALETQSVRADLAGFRTRHEIHHHTEATDD